MNFLVAHLGGGISISAHEKGKTVDAILLTVGMAYSEHLVGLIRQYAGFPAPAMVYPGENELESPLLGALRILRGGEGASELTPGGISIVRPCKKRLMKIKIRRPAPVFCFLPFGPRLWPGAVTPLGPFHKSDKKPESNNLGCLLAAGQIRSLWTRV